MTKQNRQLSHEQREELLDILKNRFEKNMNRHDGMEWNSVQSKLEANDDKLWTLYEMERTEGEPDVVGYDNENNEYIFMDCSAESPKGRRSICYDRKALDSRKKNKPENCAIDMATEMGIELLTEEQYRELQNLGNFDLKTSSWVQTPDNIRKLGELSFVIVATILSLRTIMEQIPIMRKGIPRLTKGLELYFELEDENKLPNSNTKLTKINNIIKKRLEINVQS